MTPTKDALETGTSSADSADSQLSQSKSRPRPDSPHLRADAVSLEVPIKVHGSLVPNLAPGASPQAQPFEEQTTTMIVFPQGGVLKMSTGVSAGQVMVLTNLKSRQDAICRVIKVRAYGKTQSYVEIEFTNPQPAYWGVYFPTDAPDVARTAPPEQAAAPSETMASALVAPTAPSVETRAVEPVTPAPPVIAPVAKQPEPMVQEGAASAAPVIAPSAVKPKLPESAFASIGTKEDALPSASVNKVPRASSFVSAASAKSPASADHDVSDVIDALIAPSMPAARATTKFEGLKSQRVEREVSADPVDSHGSAARLASATKSAAEQALPMPKQMFGVELESASSVAAKPSTGSGGKAMGLVGIAALLVAAVGGAYHLNLFNVRSVLHRSAASSAAAGVVSAAGSQPAMAQSSSAQASAPAVNAAPQQSVNQLNAPGQPSANAPQNRVLSASPESDMRATEEVVRPRPAEAVPERREKALSAASRDERAAAPGQPNVAIPSTFGALNSRPVVNSQPAANTVGAAPALEPDGGPAQVGSALSALAAPPAKLAAPPKPVSSAPIRVGGKIQPPRLISSVLPVYPQIAQQANVSGTVVIDTTIDKNGNVSDMKVISGPTLLRGAALSALRKWKYEPSRLNGEPLAVKLVVSIQFH